MTSNIAPSRVRAANRAPIREEEVREPVREEMRAPQGLVRKRKGNVDKFLVPDSVIARFAAAGYSIEWKRHTVFGQDDPGYDVALAENCWEAVTSEEIPGFMPAGFKGAIVRDGLQLMKRPSYLTDEARSEDKQMAREAIRIQEGRLGQTPPGTMTRDHQTARPKVGKSYEPLAVPQD